MSNKTISINTSYFNIGGSKTKKNKENKEKPVIKPLIKPNTLKNKFLKRIKEHKQRETQGFDDKKNGDKITENVPVQFSDEFSDSINYLQTLSKQKKINDEKTNYEKQKLKRKEILEKKTIKNHQNISEELTKNNLYQVNIDLPEELKIEMPQQLSNNSMVLNKPIKDNVPYGILKGGLKPTYRDWSKTHRNNVVVNPNAALTIQGDKINKEKIDRELRLQSLREKLKKKQQEEQINKQASINQINEVAPINQINSINQVAPISSINEVAPINNLEHMNEINIGSSAVNLKQNSIKENLPVKEEIIATKKITKKTIKKKYTLGKSKIKKAVGVLIKDRRTRKHVISAQKDLKKKNINDVKAYLRDHNLIKIGSNAPNDVIRKLYESAMLSGEITNSNSENLLHNFSKEEKQL